MSERVRRAPKLREWSASKVPERLERYELKRRERKAGRVEPGERPRPALPAGTDLLPEIKHVVVLMMENHSYDNYFGMLAGRGEGFTLDASGQPTESNLDAEGKPVGVFRQQSTVQQKDVPCQSWYATHLQVDDGKMDGFVTSAQTVTPDLPPTAGMGYWTEQDLPFYYGLARTFPLADHWFSSCPGPTFPNRRFLIAGTANGLVDDAPFHLLDYPPAGTVFDLLTRHGIEWANYHPIAGDHSHLRRVSHHRRRMARRRLAALVQGLRGTAKGIQKDIVFTADLFPLGIGQHLLHVHGMDRFFADAEAGKLPAFSIVDPSFEEFSEENPQDIRKGESFAAEVINAVMHGKGWPDTLLIWTYDEHGGYYDHVPPPPAVEPDDVEGRSFSDRASALQAAQKVLFPKHAKDAQTPDGLSQRYDRYGPRVPAVLVSPYARPDCVISEVFDHTSVLKLLQEKWNLPALTRRDAAATAPLGALDLTAPPAFLDPPRLPEPGLGRGNW